MPQLTAWSHSRLSVYESCPQRAKLAFVDKIKEPERPLPPGKTEHANDRGTRVHEAAEAFVKGGVELVDELKNFSPEMHQLRDLAAKGRVSLEGEWGFDREWRPVAWMSHDVWCRIKPDATILLDDTRAVTVDHKTGKRFGNEVKHHEQMQLYQLGTFLRYPELEEVTVELWYHDLDELHRMKYKREQGLRFSKGFEDRATIMLEDKSFKAKPSAHACRWCPYRAAAKGGTGDCKVGM